MRFKGLAWTAIVIQVLLLLYATMVRAVEFGAAPIVGGSAAAIIGFIMGSLVYVFSGWAVLFFAVVAIRDWDED